MTAPSRQPVPIWSVLNGTALTHVVSTRFCLGQGNQTALVEARLSLLFSLCVPTLAQQGDARFTWLIYYDSSLAAEYLSVATARLQPMARRGFRLVHQRVHDQWSLSAQEQLQLAGLWAPPPSGTRVIYMASRLDADDGLPRGAIVELQGRARHALAHCARALPVGAPAPLPAAARAPELAICYADSYEWAPSAAAKTGRLSLDDGEACLSVALSVASCRSAAAATKLVGAHNQLLGEWKGRRECVRHSQHTEKFQPDLVIRARTVTSDGMSHVKPAAAVGASTDPHSQEAFLRAMYAISSTALEATNRWLVAHEKQIAASQLEDRCRPGYSCKAAAGAELKSLAKGRRLSAHQRCALWHLSSDHTSTEVAASAPSTAPTHAPPIPHRADPSGLALMRSALSHRPQPASHSPAAQLPDLALLSRESVELELGLV